MFSNKRFWTFSKVHGECSFWAINLNSPVTNTFLKVQIFHYIPSTINISYLFVSAGFNPVWHDTLQFTIHVPELALVRFVVEDYDKTSKNDFVGQFTLPFICIQPGTSPFHQMHQKCILRGADVETKHVFCFLIGYRHIHLLSKDGTSIPPSSLFVHVRITKLM